MEELKSEYGKFVEGTIEVPVNVTRRDFLSFVSERHSEINDMLQKHKITHRQWACVAEEIKWLESDFMLACGDCEGIEFQTLCVQKYMERQQRILGMCDFLRTTTYVPGEHDKVITYKVFKMPN